MLTQACCVIIAFLSDMQIIILNYLHLTLHWSTVKIGFRASRDAYYILVAQRVMLIGDKVLIWNGALILFITYLDINLQIV